MNKPPQLYHDTPKGDLSKLIDADVPTLKLRLGRDNAGNEWSGDEIVAAHVFDAGRDGGTVWVSIQIPDVAPPTHLKQWVSRPRERVGVWYVDDPLAPRDEWINAKMVAWKTDGGMQQQYIGHSEPIPQPPTKYGPIKCYMPDEWVELDNQKRVARVVSVTRVVCSIRPVGPYEPLPTGGGPA